MPSNEDWARAYRNQAESDLQIYKLLNQPEIGEIFGFSPEKCHLVHYLQMCLEEISKAYLLRNKSTSLFRVQSGHVVVGKILSAIVGSSYIQMKSEISPRALRAYASHFNQIAREIERMAPAVDRVKHPINAEYPWENGGIVLTPARYDFPNLNLSDAGVIGPFLKTVEMAIRDFDRIAI